MFPCFLRDVPIRRELNPLRKLALIVAAVLLAGLGLVAPATAPAASAATGPKVAIIVGATHSATAQYRSYADQIYAEAIKYTPNIIKVYSPNATWTKVKAAVDGASIIVYLGHGNGWPSPYTYDPNYTTKDGFGLNYDVNKDGKLSDNELKYYGEPKIETLTPAPNAVVLLFHLCYASGNPESGPESDITKAQQRVDNYAAAFIKAGARAVIANGHSHDPYYIRALFTTNQTIDEYWRNAPDANDNVATYASVRNPGSTFQMDPERTGYYYRSVAGDMALTTEQVTGASAWSIPADPATFVLPNAEIPLARLLDTRVDNGLSGAFKSGVARTFQVAGRGGVPEDAVAVTGNLTVTRQTSSGYISLTPVPTNSPKTSTLNFPLTDTRANGITVPLGADGTLSATFKGASGATTALVFDVTGYFLAGTDGASYVPLSPSRLLDTRVDNGLSGAFKSGVARTFQVAGRGGVPEDAVAVTGNLTVTRQTSSGYISLTPVPTNSPKTSTLNFPLTDTRANGITVPLGADGTLSATFKGASGATTALVFDVTGYFLAGTDGASYVPLSPSRLLDTRVDNGLSGAFKSGVARTFQVAGRGGVPEDAVAVTGNLTVTRQTSSGYISLTPVPTNSPKTSTLNFPLTDTRANGITVPLGADGTLSATFKGASGATTALVFDVTGYFLP